MMRATMLVLCTLLLASSAPLSLQQPSSGGKVISKPDSPNGPTKKHTSPKDKPKGPSPNGAKPKGASPKGPSAKGSSPKKPTMGNPPKGTPNPTPKPTPKAGGVSISVGYGSSFTYNVPAGAVDALPYFVKAMDQLKASKGGTLTIGRGTFILSYNWEVTASNTLIQGAGMGATVLKLKDNAPEFEYAGLLYAMSVNSVTVKDLTLDGNRAKQSAKGGYGKFCLLMADYKKWTYQRVECSNHLFYGFDPHGIKEQTNGIYNPKDTRNVWSYDLVIEDCISHNNGLDGFTVDMTIGVLVRNCTAYKNGRHGINIVTASSKVIVENNRVYDNGLAPPGSFACGLLADTNKPGFVTNNVVFRNNKVERQGGTGGVCVKGARDVQFINNRISDSVMCGNFARPETGIELRGNTCSGNRELFRFREGGAKVSLVDNILK